MRHACSPTDCLCGRTGARRLGRRLPPAPCGRGRAGGECGAPHVRTCTRPAAVPSPPAARSSLFPAVYVLRFIVKWPWVIDTPGDRPPLRTAASRGAGRLFLAVLTCACGAACDSDSWAGWTSAFAGGDDSCAPAAYCPCKHELARCHGRTRPTCIPEHTGRSLRALTAHAVNARTPA
jgi:hypothetical protein